MTELVVEDGSGITGANGYVTMEVCASYAAAHGLTFADSPSTDGETAIIRASAAIDAKYRSRFWGYKTHGRSQRLEWPRTGVLDREYLPIGGTEIPQEIKDAVCEAAVRELADPGSMMPDLERGGQIRSVQAGSVRVEYGANSTALTAFTIIDGILASLFSVGSGPYNGVAVRG